MMIAFLRQRQIPYIIHKSKKAKKQKIIISHSGVKIIIPHKFNSKISEKFILNHEEWIVKKWQKYAAQNYEYNLPVEFKNNCKLPYQGKLYNLQINKADIIIPKIELTDSFKIKLPHYFEDLKYEAEIKKLYQKFLKRELKQKIEFDLQELTEKTGIIFNSYRIRNQQTRWGSCSSKGNINLNFNLIFAPIAVLEYVIIHEFSHLKHQNHSKEFWQMVASLQPNYKSHKKWLKENPHIISFASRLE